MSAVRRSLPLKSLQVSGSLCYQDAFGYKESMAQIELSRKESYLPERGM